jgi:hypothetical protein
MGVGAARPRPRRGPYALRNPPHRVHDRLDRGPGPCLERIGRRVIRRSEFGPLLSALMRQRRAIDHPEVEIVVGTAYETPAEVFDSVRERQGIAASATETDLYAALEREILAQHGGAVVTPVLYAHRAWATDLENMHGIDERVYITGLDEGSRHGRADTPGGGEGIGLSRRAHPRGRRRPAGWPVAPADRPSAGRMSTTGCRRS